MAIRAPICNSLDMFSSRSHRMIPALHRGPLLIRTHSFPAVTALAMPLLNEFDQERNLGHGVLSDHSERALVRALLL